MACDCDKESSEIEAKSALIILLCINGFMFCAELIIGVIGESSGLVADSLDMLADAIVYGVSLYAVGRSHAVKISAARCSGIFQVTLACGVLIDIIRRFVFGSDPVSWIMFLTGLVAFAANLTSLAILSKHRKGEVHMRASWIFSKNDIIANLGVIVAGLLVYFLESRWPDIIIGLLITVVVLRGGITILKEATEEGASQND